MQTKNTNQKKTQVEWTWGNKNITYEEYIIGENDKSIISKMTSEELLMYSECITAIGKDQEALDWASEDICNLIRKTPTHFKCQVVSIDSKEKKVKIKLF